MRIQIGPPGAWLGSVVGVTRPPRSLFAVVALLAVLSCRAVSTDPVPESAIAADAAARVTRGAYLQQATPDSVIVRWRTDVPTDARVIYGTVEGQLDLTARSNLVTTEHEVLLSALNPETRYFYAIGSSAGIVQGEDSGHSFLTPPPIGSTRPVRIWVLGDSGTANSSARRVRDAYYAYSAQSETNLWLMLGDNAYEDGKDSEYQKAVFEMYPAMLMRSVLWPTIGNHDTAQSTNPSPSLPYFNIFTLPTRGEAGGLASGTEKYYSFDYANIHFICLDSMTSNRSPDGAMLTWLSNDLASTGQQWIIAYWHHPPYSKGSHDSDRETPLVQMRENALPILENGGVDLVLAGHSHDYERSFLIDHHYGRSSTFSPSMKIDGGSGRPSETGAYHKDSASPTPHEGAVYAVAGSSGQTSGGSLNHPAMFVSLNRLGSLVLDVNGNRLEAKFLRDTSAVDDSFTMIKGPPVPIPPSGLVASVVSPAKVDLQWKDGGGDELGYRIESSIDGIDFTTAGTSPAGSSSYRVDHLQPSTSYWFRVVAFNDAGDSPFSNVVTATTQRLRTRVHPR